MGSTGVCVCVYLPVTIKEEEGMKLKSMGDTGRAGGGGDDVNTVLMCKIPK